MPCHQVTLRFRGAARRRMLSYLLLRKGFRWRAGREASTRRKGGRIAHPPFGAEAWRRVALRGESCP